MATHSTPLHCFLENPMDEGAWWAAIYGVTQSHDWSDLAAEAAVKRSQIEGLGRNTFNFRKDINLKFAFEWT